MLAASVALHLFALALLVRIAPPPVSESSPPPSDVAVVFESAKPSGPPLSNKPASVPATPQGPETPPAAAPTSPPAQAIAPTPTPAIAPTPTPPSSIEQPASPRVQAPLDQLATLPPPLAMPLPPKPAQLRPAPRPAARNGSFPQPLKQNWFYSRSATMPRQAVIAAGPSSNQSGDLQGAEELGPDWGSELRAYVEAHARYPEQAAQNGEQGDATVQVTADSDGHVASVSLEQRSGSVWLDAELLSIFRHARLPPFPAGTSQPNVTFHFTLHYILRG